MRDDFERLFDIEDIPKLKEQIKTLIEGNSK